MTTTGPSTVFPNLSYRDVAAAIEHIVTAFGFTPLQLDEGDDGAVVHAELALGNGVVMLSPMPDDGAEPWQEGRTCVYVAVEDLDAHHARAVAAGAAIRTGLRHTDYGSRDYTATDPEGHVWVFGTYRPLHASTTA